MHLRHVPAIIVALPAMLAAQQSGFSDPAREAKLRAAFPAVDRIMQAFTEREHVPGAAWAIVLDDRVVHMGVLGLRDIATKKPVDSTSVFRIASMTKSFTAMAIMRLRDEGKLSLDDPAEKYVPELKALADPTSDSPKITIRHLLSHAWPHSAPRRQCCTAERPGAPLASTEAARGRAEPPPVGLGAPTVGSWKRGRCRKATRSTSTSIRSRCSSPT